MAQSHMVKSMSLCLDGSKETISVTSSAQALIRAHGLSGRSLKLYFSNSILSSTKTCLVRREQSSLRMLLRLTCIKTIKSSSSWWKRMSSLYCRTRMVLSTQVTSRCWCMSLMHLHRAQCRLRAQAAPRLQVTLALASTLLAPLSSIVWLVALHRLQLRTTTLKLRHKSKKLQQQTANQASLIRPSWSLCWTSCASQSSKQTLSTWPTSGLIDLSASSSTSSLLPSSGEPKTPSTTVSSSVGLQRL